MPEIVRTDKETDLKAVNYLQLIPLLTAALQEQQDIIETLEGRVAALEE